jgi:adenylate kinase family enzyme
MFSVSIRMKRVLVIGSSGAGKSTFSRRLNEVTSISLIHLDQLHWKPNWTEPSKDEWRKTVEQAVKDEEWIMDGNYSGTLDVRIEASDTIIFLDLPRVVCIWRILKRVAKYWKKNRPDMAEGCYEQFDLPFLKWVWDYPNRTKPKVEALLKKHRDEKTVFQLKSNTDVKSFFVNLEKNKVRF